MAVKKKGLGAKGLGINALINTEMEDMNASKKETKKTEEAVLTKGRGGGDPKGKHRDPGDGDK